MGRPKGSLNQKTKNRLQKNKKVNTDGLANVFTNTGTRYDRNKYSRFVRDAKLDYNQLESLYIENGLARRIVDLIPHEMTREWFVVEGDPDNKILGYLENLSAKKKITNMLTWSRLYGGAIIVMGINDGRNIDEPVNEDNIQSIEFLHVFDRTLVDYGEVDLYQDPLNKKYLEPEYYLITPVYGASFYVHETRVLRADGEKLPPRLSETFEGWGTSIVQPIYNDLVRLESVYSATANIVQDYIQTTISIKNLSDLLAAGNDKLVRDRLDAIDFTRHVNNTILLDAEETYEKKASSVSGLDLIMAKQNLKFASSVGLPYIVIFGQPPSGLQSTGQTDIRMFYDNISSHQEDVLLPIVEKLIYYCIKAKDLDISLDNWHVKFNPLWQLSNQEVAETKKLMAEADALYADRGILTPTEIANSRFGGETYTTETIIDKSVNRESLREEIDPLAQKKVVTGVTNDPSDRKT